MVIFLLIIPLILYLIFFTVCFVYLKRSGLQDKSGKKMMIFYLAASGLVAAAFIAAYFFTDWENLFSLLKMNAGEIFSKFSL